MVVLVVIKNVAAALSRARRCTTRDGMGLTPLLFLWSGVVIACCYMLGESIYR